MKGSVVDLLKFGKQITLTNGARSEGLKYLRHLCGLVFCENFTHLALKCDLRRLWGYAFLRMSLLWRWTIYDLRTDLYFENFVHLVLNDLQRWCGVAVFAIFLFSAKELRRLGGFLFCKNFIHLALNDLRRLWGFAFFANASTLALNDLHRFTTFARICILPIASNDLRRLCGVAIFAYVLHLALKDVWRLCGFVTIYDVIWGAKAATR